MVTEKWTRWRSGSWRIHLTTGGWIDCDGRVRFKDTGDNWSDYQLDADTVPFYPRFQDVVAIEQRLPKL